jgi:Flp pilus assembly protein CpaB
MNQRRTTNKFVHIGIGVIGLAILAGVFLMPRGGSSSNGSSTVATSSEPTVPVVFATQSIPQGSTFKYGEPLDTFFTVRRVPRSLAPFGAYSSVSEIESSIKGSGCQPADQAGCTGQITATQTIYQNLPVMSGMFSSLGAFRSAPSPAFTIPYGFVAMSVDLTATNAVGGSIKPGDTIDLMATYNDTQPKGGETQYAMTNVKVIGIGSLSAPQASTSSSSSNSSAPSGSTVSLVILARYQQALVVQHLKDAGWQLSAVLRSARQTSSIPHFKTSPVTNRWYFTKSSNPF